MPSARRHFRRPAKRSQAYQIWIGTSTGRNIEGNIAGTSWTPTVGLPDGNIRWWIRDMASTSGGLSDVGTASISAGSVNGTYRRASPASASNLTRNPCTPTSRTFAAGESMDSVWRLACMGSDCSKRCCPVSFEIP